MITPEEVRKKAERAYPRILAAWAQGGVDRLFPFLIRANLSPIQGNVPGTISAVDQLRAGSKEQSGSGYSLHWKQIRSRDFGNNRFPDQITIDTLNDFLLLARQQKHFAATCEVAERI